MKLYCSNQKYNRGIEVGNFCWQFFIASKTIAKRKISQIIFANIKNTDIELLTPCIY